MTQDVETAERAFAEGNEAARLGDFKAAAEAFRQSVQAFPSYAPSHVNLGSALAELGEHEQAAQVLQQAITLERDNPLAFFLLGISLQVLGDRQQSMACFAMAATQDPSNDEALYYLGLAHQRGGALREALACMEQACQINPTDADYPTAAGTLLMQLREPEKARDRFEAALRIDPSNSVARAQVLFRDAADCNWDSLDAKQEAIRGLGIDGDPSPPFISLVLEDQPDLQRKRAERYAAANFGQVSVLPPRPIPGERPSRLKIGYFSSDIRDHATMYLAANMLERHDSERFEVLLYSYGRNDGGTMRERADKAVDRFRDVREMSAKQIADLARQDEIDIAVDLKGYTEGQRLEILAAKPAPLQMSYLGYPGSTGASFIDYLIADAVVIPDQERANYSECVAFLPDCYQVNDAERPIPSGKGSRQDHGLPADAFVFCSFNNSYKIRRSEFDIWMSLLSEEHNSVLWLLDGGERMKSNLWREAENRGVDKQRLLFAPKVDQAEHLDRHVHADLFLDTFICNAHTSASDALWAGLPVVTLPGRGFSARVATSLVQAVGLDELVATSRDDYRRIALGLAKDPVRLAEVRSSLATARLNAPLFNTEQTVKAVEEVYDRAFGRYLAGKEPSDLRINRL